MQHRKSGNVSERVRRGAGRMIHRLRQTEGLAESLAAEVNILTPSHMRTRTPAAHTAGLYLDDKWRYNHTPHSPFPLLSGSGLKTIYFKLAKNKKKQNQRVSISDSHCLASAFSFLCVSNLLSLFLVLLSSPSVVFLYIERK